MTEPLKLPSREYIYRVLMARSDQIKRGWSEDNKGLHMIPDGEIIALKRIKLKIDWLRKNTTPVKGDERTVSSEWVTVLQELNDVIRTLERKRDEAEEKASPPDEPET